MIPTGAPMTPAERLLVQIRAQVGFALEALADENEGNTRRAVMLIEGDAIALANMVRDW